MGGAFSPDFSMVVLAKEKTNKNTELKSQHNTFTTALREPTSKTQQNYKI